MAVGFGCMRLSTDPSVDERRAVRVLHAALDAGVRFFDTADVYAPNAQSLGHNERLITRALETWPGDSPPLVRIATKGGLTRSPRGGSWLPDGRARSLEAACDRSRQALGRNVIDLYLLHAPDPKTPLKTSVRALAKLRQTGRVAKIGLCNVNCQQIREAQSVTPIDAVQVALNPLDAENFRNGVAELCIHEGIQLIAHSPFGGRRAASLRKLAGLEELARHLGVSLHGLILAWLMDLASPSSRPPEQPPKPTLEPFGRPSGCA